MHNIRIKIIAACPDKNLAKTQRRHVLIGKKGKPGTVAEVKPAISKIRFLSHYNLP
jgi:hypothetical protein